jgi:hypothetical protein
MVLILQSGKEDVAPMNATWAPTKETHTHTTVLLASDLFRLTSKQHNPALA